LADAKGCCGKENYKMILKELMGPVIAVFRVKNISREEEIKIPAAS